ncbi:MAG: ABC transporter ATP-binding protein [Nitrososphaera sp.]
MTSDTGRTGGPDMAFGSGENIVEVHDLGKVYGREETSTVALDSISFEIKKGEFVLIVGQSGSGKSTLLNMLGLLDHPTSGRIAIDGIETVGLSDSEKAELRRYRIGFIFQSYNLLTDLTVIDNVMLPLMMAGADQGIPREEAALEILDRVGIAAHYKKLANHLSGGQMQRVAVARALVNHPALVLGDEPTGNLDSKNSMDVVALMKQLNRELHQTFVIVTHAREMFGDVDRVITLKDGKIERIERGI